MSVCVRAYSTSRALLSEWPAETKPVAIDSTDSSLQVGSFGTGLPAYELAGLHPATRPTVVVNLADEVEEIAGFELNRTVQINGLGASGISNEVPQDL